MKRAARVWLEMAADRMAKQLLKMATGDDVADSVKLAAIRDALDRGGVSAKTAIELEVGPTKPWEELLTTIVGGSRAESRAQRGMRDEPVWPGYDEILDAEIVEANTYSAPSYEGCGDEFPEELPDWLDRAPQFCRNCRGPDPYAAGEPRRAGLPNGGLVPMDEAVSWAAEHNRRMRKDSPAPTGKRRR